MSDKSTRLEELEKDEGYHQLLDCWKHSTLFPSNKSKFSESQALELIPLLWNHLNILEDSLAEANKYREAWRDQFRNQMEENVSWQQEYIRSYFQINELLLLMEKVHDPCEEYAGQHKSDEGSFHESLPQRYKFDSPEYWKNLYIPAQITVAHLTALMDICLEAAAEYEVFCSRVDLKRDKRNLEKLEAETIKDLRSRIHKDIVDRRCLLFILEGNAEKAVELAVSASEG